MAVIPLPEFSDVESFEEYFERLRQRSGDEQARESMSLRVWQFARTADKHLQRFRSAAARYRRACVLHDEVSKVYERDTMLALLYEAADTVYITIQILDPDLLRLEASADGLGITGEDAVYVYELLRVLERVCGEILDLSRKFSLELNFSKPVDEREALTYTDHPHWQDFVRGSLRDSFFDYFAHTRHALGARLNQVPRFWEKQTLRQALLRGNRPALGELIQRLMNASLPGIGAVHRAESLASSGTHAEGVAARAHQQAARHLFGLH